MYREWDVYCCIYCMCVMCACITVCVCICMLSSLYNGVFILFYVAIPCCDVNYLLIR